MADNLWTGYGQPLAIMVLEILAICVPLMIAMAYLTYAERKVQRRRSCARGRTSSAGSGSCNRSPTG